MLTEVRQIGNFAHKKYHQSIVNFVVVSVHYYEMT